MGLDSKTKMIHTVVATAANLAEATVLPELLHGEETRVWGDQGYVGRTEVIHECAPQSPGLHARRVFNDLRKRVEETEAAEESETEAAIDTGTNQAEHKSEAGRSALGGEQTERPKSPRGDNES